MSIGRVSLAGMRYSRLAPALAFEAVMRLINHFEPSWRVGSITFKQMLSVMKGGARPAMAVVQHKRFIRLPPFPDMYERQKRSVGMLVGLGCMFGGIFYSTMRAIDPKGSMCTTDCNFIGTAVRRKSR